MSWLAERPPEGPEWGCPQKSDTGRVRTSFGPMHSSREEWSSDLPSAQEASPFAVPNMRSSMAPEGVLLPAS